MVDNFKLLKYEIFKKINVPAMVFLKNQPRPDGNQSNLLS